METKNLISRADILEYYYLLILMEIKRIISVARISDIQNKKKLFSFLLPYALSRYSVFSIVITDSDLSISKNREVKY